MSEQYVSSICLYCGHTFEFDEPKSDADLDAWNAARHEWCCESAREHEWLISVYERDNNGLSN